MSSPANQPTDQECRPTKEMCTCVSRVLQYAAAPGGMHGAYLNVRGQLGYLGTAAAPRMEEKGRLVGEVKKQLRLAGPLVLTSSIQFVLQLISTMFVGRLGVLALSGATMATSLAGVTGYTFLVGMSTAMDTLCGQAYGAKQHRMIGIHLQRAMTVLMLISIPITLTWAFADQILVGLHQDHEMAKVAGMYARWLIPSLFGFGLLQCYGKFLQAQSLVLPLLLSSCFVALLHILSCWVLVFKLDLGIKGSAIALSISYWVNALLLALYVEFSPTCKDTWTGFSREAVHGIYNYIKLAVPSTGMICLEYWAYEVLIITSGLLPNPKLEASLMSIIIGTATLASMMALGLGAAVSTRVSNELGAGNPQVARFAIFVGTCITVVEGVTLCVVLVCIRHVWGHAYSSDRDVVRQVANIMPVLALSPVADSINAVLQGTARGCGWQKMCVLINISTFYAIGIPISVVTAFVLHLGAKGLWIGIICALAVQIVTLSTIILSTDWNKEVKKANDRVNESSISMQTTK